MSKNVKTDIDNLIVDFLDGKLDVNGNAQLEQWVSSSEENMCYFKDKMEVWFSSIIADDAVAFDKEEAYQHFKAKTQAKENAKELNLKSWWYRIAAVAVLALVSTLSYYQGREQVTASFADVIIESPKGSKTKLYLPDGSLVWLNADSKIVYSQGFGVNNRDLTLEGEGYFEVVKNKKLPFRVNTENVDLQVLGTKFNFKAYIEDNEVIINLIEGDVALKNNIINMPLIYMVKNDRVILEKVTGKMRKRPAQAISARAWTNGELLFDEEILEDIAKRLERAYNVDIKVNDSVKDRRFYGAFINDKQTIEDVLKTMSSTGRVKYKYVNNRYELY